MFDVMYAMDWTVPFRDDETVRDFHHFKEIPDRGHRVRVFLDADGVHDDRATWPLRSPSFDDRPN